MALSEDEQILGNLIHEVSSLQAKLENMKGTLAYRLRDEEEAKLRLETAQATVNSFRLDVEKYQLAYEEAKLNLENYILKQHALKLAQAELEQDPDFNSRAKEEELQPQIPDPDEIEDLSPVEVSRRLKAADILAKASMVDDVFGQHFLDQDDPNKFL